MLWIILDPVKVIMSNEDTLFQIMNTSKKEQVLFIFILKILQRINVSQCGLCIIH